MISNLKIAEMCGITSMSLQLKPAVALAGPAGSGKTTVANALRVVAAIHQRNVMPTHDEPGGSWARTDRRTKTEAGTTIELAGNLPDQLHDTGWKTWYYRCTVPAHLGLPLIGEQVGAGRTAAEAAGGKTTICEAKTEGGYRPSVGRYQGSTNSNSWRQMEDGHILTDAGAKMAGKNEARIIEYLTGLFVHRLAQSPPRLMNRLVAELQRLWKEPETRNRLLEEASGLLPGPSMPATEPEPEWLLEDTKRHRAPTTRMSSRERNAVALAVLLTNAMTSKHRDNVYIIDSRRLDPEASRAAQLAAVDRLTRRGQVLIDMGDQVQGLPPGFDVIDLGHP